MKKITVECPKCEGKGGETGGKCGNAEWFKKCDLCQGKGELVLKVLKEED